MFPFAEWKKQVCAAGERRDIFVINTAAVNVIISLISDVIIVDVNRMEQFVTHRLRSGCGVKGARARINELLVEFKARILQWLILIKKRLGLNSH